MADLALHVVDVDLCHQMSKQANTFYYCTLKASTHMWLYCYPEGTQIRGVSTSIPSRLDRGCKYYSGMCNYGFLYFYLQVKLHVLEEASGNAEAVRLVLACLDHLRGCHIAAQIESTKMSQKVRLDGFISSSSAITAHSFTSTVKAATEPGVTDVDGLPMRNSA